MSNYTRPGYKAIKVGGIFNGAFGASKPRSRQLALRVHVLIDAPILQGVWVRHLPRPGECPRRP